MFLGPEAETQEADQLRGAVTEALCRSDKRRGQFAEALTSIQTEDNLKQCAGLGVWSGGHGRAASRRSLRCWKPCQTPRERVSSARCRAAVWRAMKQPSTRWTLAAPPASFSYCERLQDPAFWGGEPELLVLSKMLKLPIYVYVDADARRGGWAGVGPAWCACTPRQAPRHRARHQPLRRPWPGRRSGGTSSCTRWGTSTPTPARPGRNGRPFACCTPTATTTTCWWPDDDASRACWWPDDDEKRTRPHASLAPGGRGRSACHHLQFHRGAAAPACHAGMGARGAGQVHAWRACGGCKEQKGRRVRAPGGEGGGLHLSSRST